MLGTMRSWCFLCIVGGDFVVQLQFCLIYGTEAHRSTQELVWLGIGVCFLTEPLGFGPRLTAFEEHVVSC